MLSSNSKSNYLSQSLISEDQRLIRVIVWNFKKEVPRQYITYSFSISLLKNYFIRIGFINVIRKVISRFSENKRNKKYFGFGIGEVIDKNYKKNERVLFFATNHNPDWEFVVLNKSCILNIKKDDFIDEKFLDNFIFPYSLNKFIGYSFFSGLKLNTNVITKELSKINLTKYNDIGLNHNVNKNNNYLTLINSGNNFYKNNNSRQTNAVLFGLGNYAKTLILPNIKRNIRIDRIHELDPDQLDFFYFQKHIELTTSPYPIDNKFFDAWFIAGYHSTHIELAIQALKKNSYAVVEKPLATSIHDLNKFEMELVNNKKSKFFCCFQRRYSYMNFLLARDIDINKPIDMHCIVYEIPLPELHWYNWPSSKSRLVSNACHWIDYFLFLNSYSDIKEKYIWNPKGNDLCINLKLMNGAYLSFSLTDVGSIRLGVRDYIELRQEDITVRMLDSSLYISEDNRKVIRRKKINPLQSYSRMYREISNKISRRENGDNLNSLLSSRVTLELETYNNKKSIK